MNHKNLTAVILLFVLIPAIPGFGAIPLSQTKGGFTVSTIKQGNLLDVAACSSKQIASESSPTVGNSDSSQAAIVTDNQTGTDPGGLSLRSYEFDTVTGDGGRRKGQARYYVEDKGRVRLEMVEIPGGTFNMGSARSEIEDQPGLHLGAKDEQPLHQVTVQAFYMGKYEVTQAQWRAVASLPKVSRDLDPDPSHFKGGDLPVEQVSWKAAMEFCARLSRATGRSYRLPSEAEWEYACRAGATTEFAFGRSITTELVNYNAGAQAFSPDAKGGRERTMPVGSLGVANAFGLYDMHGNVSEWCLDYAQFGYVGAPKDGSVWRAPRRLGRERSEDMRSARGGSWMHASEDCRAARRDAQDVDRKSGSVGFRVVEQKRDPNHSSEVAPLWTVSDKAKLAVQTFLAANKTYHLLAASDIPADWLNGREGENTGYDIQQVDMAARAISEGDANGDGIDDALAIVVTGKGDHKLYGVICFNGRKGGGYNPAPFWVVKNSTEFIGLASIAERSFDRKYKYWTPPTIYAIEGLFQDYEPGDDDFYTWNGSQYEQGYFATGERVEIPIGIKIFSQPSPVSEVVRTLKSEAAALVVLSPVPEKVKGVRWYKVQALKNRTSTVVTSIIGFVPGDQITRWAEEH